MEKKVYTMGDIEELDMKLQEIYDDDFETIINLLADVGVNNEYDFFGEVMAGGLTEEEVCTPAFCEKLCKGMQQVIDNHK